MLRLKDTLYGIGEATHLFTLSKSRPLFIITHNTGSFFRQKQIMGQLFMHSYFLLCCNLPATPTVIYHIRFPYWRITSSHLLYGKSKYYPGCLQAAATSQVSTPVSMSCPFKPSFSRVDGEQIIKINKIKIKARTTGEG